MRRPVPIFDNGILWGGMIVPWRYVRGVEWVEGKEITCRLHRYDGDMYLVIPRRIANEVRKFLAEKLPQQDGIQSNRSGDSLHSL